MAHVCRISRVLRQPARQRAAARRRRLGPPVALAARIALADFRVFQIEITKNYRVLEWREDLKTVLKIAG